MGRALQIPLGAVWWLLADRYRGGEADERAWVYAAGGYYHPGEQIDLLRSELQGYLDLGYDTVKMKIGGADLETDLRRIEAALGVVGDGWRLAVDANGRFDFETALAYAKAIEGFGLRWYEEPLEPLDFLMHAALTPQYQGPIATGENIFSMVDARNLIRHGGLWPDRDVLQFDPALSYGLVEYMRTLEMLKEHGWPARRCVPHGGHQFALHIALGFSLGGNESYPRVFAPFGGFADDRPVHNGRIEAPDGPGIGFGEKRDLWKVLRGLVDDLLPTATVR